MWYEHTFFIVFTLSSLFPWLDDTLFSPQSVFWVLNSDDNVFIFRVLTVAFVKRGPHLENTKRLTRQIQAIQLPQDSTYESLHAVLSAAIIPIFNSFVTKSGK